MPKALNWTITDADLALVKAIVERAAAIYTDLGAQCDRMALMMDIEATHLNGCPLRLADWLAADDFNFTHDIGGIVKHMNRRTGQLEGHFLPRFAARKAATV